MKKRLALRCLVGAPLGLAISTMITILISLTVGDGNFYPVVPELIKDCGSEMNAVLLQTVCSLLYGGGLGLSLIHILELARSASKRCSNCSKMLCEIALSIDNHSFI